MEQWIRRAEELDPDAFLTLWTRQLTTSAVGDVQGGIDAAQAALAASGRHVFPLLMLGLHLSVAGDSEGAHALYDEARSRSRREYVPPAAFALLAATLGEKEVALAHCREAIATRDPQFVIFALGWPNTFALRAYPEHRAMLVEIGLPGAVAAATQESI
jgi:hypothetical protein